MAAMCRPSFKNEPSADVAAALRNGEDQALVPENSQRAARGGARHLVGLSNLRFGDPAADRQLARADLAADDLRNLKVGRHGAGRVDLRHAMIVMARDQLLHTQTWQYVFRCLVLYRYA
jgi:hypothetical protein